MKRINEENSCWTQKELFQALQKTVKKALTDNPDRSSSAKRIDFINQIYDDVKSISLPKTNYAWAPDIFIEELDLGYGSVFLWIVFRNNMLTVNMYSTINDLSVEVANVLENVNEVTADALEIDALRKRCQKLFEENEKLKEKYRIALEARQVLQELRD